MNQGDTETRRAHGGHGGSAPDCERVRAAAGSAGAAPGLAPWARSRCRGTAPAAFALVLALSSLLPVAARADTPVQPRRAVGVNTALLVGGYGRFKTLDGGFGTCTVPCSDTDTTRYTERPRVGVGLQSLFRSGEHLQLGLGLWVMTAWQAKLRGLGTVDLGARFDVGLSVEYFRPLGRTALVAGPQVGIGFGGGDGLVTIGLQLLAQVGFQTPFEHLLLRTTVGYQQDILLANDIDGIATLTAIGGRAVIIVGFFFGT